VSQADDDKVTNSWLGNPGMKSNVSHLIHTVIKVVKHLASQRTTGDQALCRRSTVSVLYLRFNRYLIIDYPLFIVQLLYYSVCFI